MRDPPANSVCWTATHLPGLLGRAVAAGASALLNARSHFMVCLQDITNKRLTYDEMAKLALIAAEEHMRELRKGYCHCSTLRTSKLSS